MKGSLSGLEKFKDFGLLVQRIVIGLTYVHFGWVKLMGGPKVWDQVGAAMSKVGVDFGYRYWGLGATFAELLGGFLLVIGLLVRPAAAALCGTMVVAAVLTFQGYNPGKSESVIAFYYPLSMCAVTFAMLFVGGGKYGLDGGGGGGSKASSSDSKKSK